VGITGWAWSMNQRAGILDLSPGANVVADGAEWLVESFAPQYGHVQLRRGDGTMQTTVRALLTGPTCHPPADALTLETDAARQPVTLADLTPEQRELALLRLAHVLEVETGFRGGDPLRPGPGEPRRGYDPDATSLTSRRLAKVAELKAIDPQDARRLGFAHVSLRTLERLGADCRRFGVAGAILGSRVRRSGGRPNITEPVREAIFAVRVETLHRSRISMTARHRLICQYVREKYDEQVQVPCYQTLRKVWREWFGPGGARQRYQRSAGAVEATGTHVVVHRPGQIIALDTTLLPVKVRESVFGNPVSTHLTLALDVYTHSLVAFRLTLVSDTSVDVAMLLRDVMTPLPLRDGWGEDMIWPYPGVPAAVVAEFAGYPVAA
jgi:hypothetical protein